MYELCIYVNQPQNLVETSINTLLTALEKASSLANYEIYNNKNFNFVFLIKLNS